MTIYDGLTLLYTTTTILDDDIYEDRLSTICTGISITTASLTDNDVNNKDHLINITIGQNYIQSMSEDELCEFMEKLDIKEKEIIRLTSDENLDNILSKDKPKSLKYTIESDIKHNI